MTVRTFRSTQTRPGDRGRELGRVHRDEVAGTVSAYRRVFARLAGEDVDLAHWGALAMAQILLVSADLAEEIEGIAAGAGLDVEAVAAVNARTEVLAAVGSAAAHECSAVVQLRDGRGPVAVQAWDWYADLADSWFVWEIPHADGHLTTTLTEYGIVGKIGVSTRGLGVLFNILHHERDGRTVDGRRIGAPLHVLARAVLDEASTLHQALARLAASPVSASSSITLVASARDESAAVSAELNPDGIGYAWPDHAGLLVHTNHFISTPAAWHDTELRAGPDTVVRLAAVRRRLAGRAEMTVADAIGALDSHLLGSGATCRHVDPSLPPAAQLQTLATVALDVPAGAMNVHAGGPCTFPVSTSSIAEAPQPRRVSGRG